MQTMNDYLERHDYMFTSGSGSSFAGDMSGIVAALGGHRGIRKMIEDRCNAVMTDRVPYVLRTRIRHNCVCLLLTECVAGSRSQLALF